jgi:hypothetical protein
MLAELEKASGNDSESGAPKAAFENANGRDETRSLDLTPT